MDLQKTIWKINFTSQSNPNPDHFFKMFNEWINTSPSEIFVDVIDYKHMQGGVLTLLSGCYADITYDEYNQRKGFSYSCKKFLTGSNQEKLQSTLNSFIEYSEKLLKYPLFSGIPLDRSQMNLIINDRAFCANTPENQKHLQTELEDLFEKMKWPVKHFEFNQDQRKRLEVDIFFNNPNC